MNAALSHVVWAFANSIWQSAIVAAVAWLAFRLARRTTAALRYSVWSAVLLSAAVLPLANLIVPSHVVTIAQSAAVTLAPIDPAPAGPHADFRPAMTTSATHVAVRPVSPLSLSRRSTVMVDRSTGRPDARHGRTDAVVSNTSIRATAVSAFLASLAAAGIAIDTWLLAHPAPIISLWALISGLFLVRLGVGFLRLRAIKRGLVGIDDASVTRRRLSLARRVTVGASEDVECPCVIGYAKPAVALPAALLHDLHHSDLEKVLAHEFAHVLRFDDWGNMLAQVARAVLFANPVVHLVAHRLDVDREIACDDVVAEDRVERLDYARCLTEIARRTAYAEHLLPAVGFFPDRKQIIVRIEQLLDRNHAGSARLGAIPVIASIALTAAVVLLVHHQAPAYAQGISAIDPAPAPSSAPSPAPSSAPSSAPLVAPPAAPLAAPAALQTPRPAPSPKPAPAAHAPLTALQSDAAIEARVHALAALKIAQWTALHVFTDRQDDYVLRQGELAVRAADLARVTRDLSRAEYLHAHAAYRVDVPALAVAEAKVQAASAVAAAKAASWAVGRNSSNTEADNTDAFLDALSQAGYKNVSIDELIKLRDAGVTTGFLHALKQDGMTPMPIDKVIDAANAGISADYLADMSKLGYANLGIDQTIALANAGVSPDFIAGMAKLGYAKIGASNLISLANAGVSPPYVRSLAQDGYTGVSVGDLIRMANAGVSTDMIDSLRKHGFFDKGAPSIDELIKLADAGF
jgi:beta-lactamase regulating signal transducer with metallopeptidase domain